MTAPPAVVSLRLSPNTAATGETVSVMLEWTGDPKFGVFYQWRQGLFPIAGATAAAYLIAGNEVDLNCLVTIDNGIGTAIAVAIFTNELIEAPEVPEGPESDFSDDFSDDFGG